MAVTLAQIVARLGGELRGDGDAVIGRFAALDRAGPGDICFLANPKYRAGLTGTLATAVILGPEAAAACPVACIVTAQPYLYFARLAQWLAPPQRPPCGIDAAARVESRDVAGTAHVGPGTVIESGALIGENIGARAVIHSGAVIGADGFGFARDDDGRWVKIPQTGRVIIGDDVEIGANTTIDRGALDDTVIGDGVKLDNQIQVGHNVRIGAHSALAGCVGIAGSARIGSRCSIGGAALILGHLEIADDVQISAGTLVGKSIPRPGTYTGTVPFLPHAAWMKNFAHLRHLEALADRIRALETDLARLSVELEKKQT